MGSIRKIGIICGVILVVAATVWSVYFFVSRHQSALPIRPQPFPLQQQAAPGANITAEPLSLPGGWGYKIEVNNKLYIYQNQVPCLQGQQLFPTKEMAMAVAERVVEKMKAGRIPSITMQDLEELAPSLVKKQDQEQSPAQN